MMKYQYKYLTNIIYDKKIIMLDKLEISNYHSQSALSKFYGVLATRSGASYWGSFFVCSVLAMNSFNELCCLGPNCSIIPGNSY